MPVGAIWSPNSPPVRPGVYARFRKRDQALPGARAGIVAVLLKADWGPLNLPTDETSLSDLETDFGRNLTVDTARWALMGGALHALVVRYGTGGTAATGALNDGNGDASVTLTAKWVGVRGNTLRVTNRPVVGDTTRKEIIIYEVVADGSLVARQTIRYLAGGGAEADAIVAAIAASSSPWLVATRAAGAGATMATVTASVLSGGANPTTDATAYSNGLAAFGASDFVTFAQDLEDNSYFATVASWIRSMRDGGMRGIAFVGEPSTVAFATRRADSAALNQESVVYVGNGWSMADGTLVDGYRAAAWAAGRQASLDYQATLTGQVAQNATAILGELSAPNVDKAIQSGMVIYARNPFGAVEVVYDVTTLVTPTGELDQGWQNVQRVRVRDTFMDRASLAVYPLKSVVRNDANGRMSIRHAVQAVADAMVREGGLRDTPHPVVLDDPDNPATGDKYYLVVDGDDLPPINFAFQTFEWRLSPPAAVAA